MKRLTTISTLPRGVRIKQHDAKLTKSNFTQRNIELRETVLREDAKKGNMLGTIYSFQISFIICKYFNTNVSNLKYCHDY